MCIFSIFTNIFINDSSICDSIVFFSSSGLNTESLQVIGLNSPSSVPKTIDELHRVYLLYMNPYLSYYKDNFFIHRKSLGMDAN